MNILFLTIFNLNTVEERSIYTDLLREFAKHGHKVYAVSPNERRMGKGTELIKGDDVNILKVKVGNITKCGIIEKGISTVMVETQYKNAIKKYLSDVKFDLVIYSTPPITLVNVVKYIKKRDGARSYLLLKDIFPQNAVDLGMLSKKGIKSVIYSYFRMKEKQLYAVSDKIGCMSRANCDYVLKHNPEISPQNVEVCPNSIEVRDLTLDEASIIEMRKKYELPLDKKIFVYGGNLGRPQGVPFIVECLKANENNQDVFFLIVGGGTDGRLIKEYVEQRKPQNVRFMSLLPKEDYDRMIAACDVGLIFLDHRFTIPNFPSRLLSYMQAGLPVLCCTDTATDVGKIVTDNNFGWWCESNDVEAFCKTVCEISNSDKASKGRLGHEFLLANYDTETSYRRIMANYER